MTQTDKPHNLGNHPNAATNTISNWLWLHMGVGAYISATAIPLALRNASFNAFGSAIAAIGAALLIASIVSGISYAKGNDALATASATIASTLVAIVLLPTTAVIVVSVLDVFYFEKWADNSQFIPLGVFSIPGLVGSVKLVMAMNAKIHKRHELASRRFIQGRRLCLIAITCFCVIAYIQSYF